MTETSVGNKRSKKNRKRITRLYIALVITVLALITIVTGAFIERKQKIATTNELNEVNALLAETELARQQADKNGHDQGFSEGYDQGAEEKRRELLDEIRQSFENGATPIEVLKPLYPDQIVVYSGDKYHFIDIDDSLPKSDYDINNLNILDSGEYQYVVDGEVTSVKGVDVSSHQGKIDWNKVANDGVKFAFIRVLYRGYGNGKLNVDKYAKANLAGAKAAGIDVGVYIFTQAISKAEVDAEIAEAIKVLGGTSLDMPFVVDVERVSSSGARMDRLSVDERTEIVNYYLDAIEAAGYDAMIYHNTEMGACLLETDKIVGKPTWFAGYRPEFYWPYDYQIWQYSEKGSVSGIKGNVDLDILLK